MRYDVIVIGAGPIGTTAAGILAKQGFRVLVVEEHRSIGKPMQCGGLVSPRIGQLVGFEIPILNAVKGAHVHGPEGQELQIRASHDKGIILDRTEFDRRAGKQCVEWGADLILGNRIRRLEKIDGGLAVITSAGERYDTKMVIGADGPSSVTAKFANLPAIGQMVTGYEFEAVGAPRSLDMVEVFAGQRFGTGFFSWIIPVSRDRVRIGVGVHRSPESAIQALHYLLNESIYSHRFRSIQPLSMHGGGIPIGMRPRMFADNLLVIGDAAGIAKPVSGGGIIPGIISARIAAYTVSNCLEKGDLSAKQLSQYQTDFQKEIGRELKRAWKIRKAFMHLPDNELSRFFDLLSKDAVIRKINEKGDIDYPGRMAIDLLKVSPGLFKFGLKYLGKNLL
jgi:digeranylgeranylglycerophospholipid reductase